MGREDGRQAASVDVCWPGASAGRVKTGGAFQFTDAPDCLVSPGAAQDGQGLAWTAAPGHRT